ncbi:MAG: photosynthetic reaction center subunit H [Janthinobacterium lividum]
MVPHVSFTQQFDIPELLFILFLLFFLGLVYHLRQEDKREGYPLETDPMDRSRPRVAVVGFPPMPKPKMFLRKFGEPVFAPGPRLERDLTGIAERLSDFPGSPIVPTGDPLVDGIGPASYVLKEEVPDLTWHGTPNILPLRKLPEHAVEGSQTSPIGLEVITRDRIRVGVVADVWINLSELFGRYLEVQTEPAFGGDRIILPVAFADIRPRDRRVLIGMLTARQFSKVPRLASPDVITFREEDRVNAYYAGGHLYSRAMENEEPA